MEGSDQMPTVLSFLLYAILVVLAIWAALAFAAIAIRHFLNSAFLISWRWAQAGGGAMIVPAFWFAVFFAAPYGDGMLSSLFGESLQDMGALLGFVVAIFVGVFFGAIVGAGLGASWRAVHNAQ